MNSRVQVYGGIVLVLFIAFAILKYADSELSAALWHLRHGFHTEIGRTRIWVPMSFEADDPHGLPWLFMMKSPGIFVPGGGFITINFQRLPSPQSMELADSLLKKMGKDYGSSRAKVGERNATFAGRSGKCVEYDTESRLPSPLESYVVKGYEIQCRFDPDVSVMMIGSPRLKDDFYKIIQTAEPLKAKN